ncbi:MAG: serine/threonine-protein kinase PknK, partial [Verrucomicrobia bacterium]|nr:serine/threonine-protein kinase PknK [Verrucomicrobiota bacterium]
MAELSTYSLELIQNDAGLVRYRGRRKSDLRQILVSIPEAKQAAPDLLKRLEHEYALRQELDPAWAVLPLELVHERAQTALLLQDPGGEPLDRMLGKPLELTQFLRIAISLTAAIDGVHERGIIHRDIRPANIMVHVKSGQTWLTGFGSSSHLSREHQTFGPPEVPATFEYMAPEQTGRMNCPVDARSDLYSLGITLYEMLTGLLPFAAVDPLGWAHCHIAKRPVSPGERRTEIPPMLSAIILKLLAKAPEERYQTAKGLEADLMRCQMAWESLERIDLFGLGAEDRPDRLVIPRKLYGRTKESKTLLDAFKEHLECETPVFVLISGYSGVGKSSLVNALGESVLLTSGFFVSGKCDLYKRDIPYATVGEAFQALVRQLLSKSEVELTRWGEAIRAALGSNGQLVVNLIPELELIVGQQPPIPELPVQEAQNRFREVMRAFLGVFAQKEHPLVLFLDDLQWLDPATFQLIEDMIALPGVRHLLLIGAYRDNEVGASHPLTMMVNQIRMTDAKIRKIVLAPLTQVDLGLLIADTLQQEATTVEPLARLVYEKTAGNPFFLIQFLTALFEEHLLQFDRHKMAWRWEIPRIQARQITDNVVDLMLAKLNRLPGTTREALKQLSCVGNRVKTTDVTLVCEKPLEQVQSDLWDAVQAGFIIQLTDSYSFVHDRVQEVTYSLIPEEERAAAHLRIGRLLLAGAAAEEIPEKIFEIVNQLNRGAALILSGDERERVAELNLLAGQRAQLSAAHTSALRYLSAGASLLGPAPWEHQYELVFALEFHRAKSEFVSGYLEAAEERLASLSILARTVVDHAAVACLRLDLYTMLDRSNRAVEICLEYLKMLDIEWSPHPTEEEVLQEYQEMWRRLNDRPIEALIDLPTMTDPAWCATMDVLTNVMPPAMFTDKNLQCLVLGRMANISLEHGNCDGSCLGYVWLGGVLGSRFGNYQSGFRFGRVSIALMEQRELNRFKARVYLGFGSLVNFWTRHLSTGFTSMRQALDAAQEAGDLTYAAYARYDLIGHLLSAGSPLNEVQREAEAALQLASSTRFGLMIDGVTGQLRLIRTLRGLTSIFGVFDDDHFAEAQFEQHLEADPHLANPTCRYYIRKLEARFYAGRYAQAIEAAEKAQGLLWAMPPSIEMPDYHFHAALALAQHCAGSPIQLQPQHLEALLAHENQLEVWARNCPENFGNRALLVGAEIARIKGRILEAERLYEEAIRSAHENGFVNNEAIAQEAAGKFYLDRGFAAIGRTYLRSARSCYLQWGADAKVKQLDRTYPRLEEAALGPMLAASTPLRQLDLVAVVNALQAVSREID